MCEGSLKELEDRKIGDIEEGDPTWIQKKKNEWKQEWVPWVVGENADHTRLALDTDIERV